MRVPLMASAVRGGTDADSGCLGGTFAGAVIAMSHGRRRSRLRGADAWRWGSLPLVASAVAALAVATPDVAAPGPAPHMPPPTATADAPAAGAAHSFGFDDVRKLAQERAKREYRPAADTLPETLASLSYAQYRDIRFRTVSSLWHGQSLFEVEFFHRGYHNRQRVNLFEVSSAGVVALAYNPALYSFGSLQKAPKAPASLGYAGFRVHYPLQTPVYKDELLSFLGASYFRVLGRDEHYGASARGLAIDTAAQTRRGISGLHRFLAGAPRRRASARSRSMHCWTARASPGPTSSKCGRAPSPRWRCIACSILRRADRQARRGAAHVDVSVRRGCVGPAVR